MLTYEHRIRALVEGVPEPCVFLGALLGAQSPEGGSRAYIPSVRPTYALAPIPSPSYPQAWQNRCRGAHAALLRH